MRPIGLRRLPHTNNSGYTMGRKIRNGKLAEQWRTTIAARADSGQSVREFCQQTGVAEHQYYYWQRRLNGRQRTPKPTEGPELADGFIELRAAPSAGSGVTVRLPGSGIAEIELARDFDDATLLKVINVLRPETA